MIKAEKDSDSEAVNLHPDENEELIAIHGDLDDVEAVVRKHYPDAVFSEPDEIGRPRSLRIHGSVLEKSSRSGR